MKYIRFIKVSILFLFIQTLAFAQTDMYWGNSLPEKWNGTWPEELLTASEKSGFTHSENNQDILEYFAMLQWRSEYITVFSMYTSDRGLTCPVLVLSNPRVSNAREAKQSGKMIVYLQGGIHTSESEGKEALLILVRDILFGNKKYLLDNLIIMVAPNFNVDGNETRSVNPGLPMLVGTRQDARGFDINRDAIKLETTSMKGAYTTVFNTWDPTIIYDTHRMGGVKHGYPIGYAGSNVATASAGPRDFVTYNIFPAITSGAREDGKIEIYYHAGFTGDAWPPTDFTHENTIWTTEGKFMVSAYGLRNRMAILVETSWYVSYEKMIYAQYICASELLKFCNENAQQMIAICKAADDEVVKNIKEKAESGTLKNYVSGKYVSDGKHNVLGYKDIEYENIPGTSIRRVVPSHINKAPELIAGVDLITKPVGVKSATVPRGYLIPADLMFLVEKLRILGLEVTKLENPIKARGEEYVISKLSHKASGGYDMTVLEGSFVSIESKSIPAGTYILDMAQPRANLAFYALEPEVGDGFIGWNLLDSYFESLGVNEKNIVYPVFKYFKLLE